jgi:acylglycerol lipase
LTHVLVRSIWCASFSAALLAPAAFSVESKTTHTGGGTTNLGAAPLPASPQVKLDMQMSPKLKVSASSRARGLAPCLTWVSQDVDPKAALLCVHGLGLHNGAYEHFGKRMADLGIATYAVDVRGFGSWQKAQGRGDVDFDDCLTDVADTLKVIHKVHPQLPVFLLGESMGGAIALRVTSKYPDLVDGLISCVPSGDRFKQRRTELKVALQTLKGFNKKFDVGTSVIEQAGQGNQALKDSWANDPLARLKLSPKELIQFQRFMNENHESARTITHQPVLMVQGIADKLVKPEGTMELFKELSTKDKEIQLINQASHLIFEESQFNDQALNDKVTAIVHNWMTSHIKTK